MTDTDLPAGPPIIEGHAPGLLGWTVAEHARHYAREWGFGAYFEAKVAGSMAEFLPRLDPPGVQIFHVADGEGFLATVSIDGAEAELVEGCAHLRWFIANPRARGQGLGKRLIARAVASAREAGVAGVYLDTFAGLDAARAVYEGAGFVLTNEAEDRTWGVAVREQRFVLRF